MKKYFVIGNPIEHSLSPRLHNYWLNQNKIEAIYDKKLINKKDLEDICNEIRKNNINGLNVTVPFKKEIIPFLDQLSEEAEETQSVNTVYIKNNKIIGHNTDIEGFELNIKDTKFNTTGKKIFIIGAGGVVPSLIFALKRMKASNIIISNRTKQNAENLKDLFKDLTIVDWGIVPDFDMVINATSVGLNEYDLINIFLKLKKINFFMMLFIIRKVQNFLVMQKN
jgi:shikimate dehydrogenase